MGPIADRTIEHLGVGDASIIQIRKLLLQSLQDFDRGMTPPGLEAASYRARSSRFRLPKGESFRKAVEERLRATSPATSPAEAKEPLAGGGTGATMAVGSGPGDNGLL